MMKDPAPLSQYNVKQPNEQSNISDSSNSSMSFSHLLPSLLLNIVVPIVLYFLIKRYLTSSEVIALSVASLTPLVRIISSLARGRSLDILSIVTLLSTGTSLLAAVLGGSKEFVLISNGFFTGALGVACLVSLFLMPKPLMFYLRRQFLAGHNPVAIANFNARWQSAHERSVNRLITVVWGCSLFGQFLFSCVCCSPWSFPIPWPSSWPKSSRLLLLPSRFFGPLPMVVARSGCAINGCVNSSLGERASNSSLSSKGVTRGPLKGS